MSGDAPTAQREQTDLPDQQGAADQSRAAKPRSRAETVQRFAALLAGTLTLLIAIWGAITGTIAWQENREISLDITAEANAGFYGGPTNAVAPDEFVASVVNTSPRAVTLLRGDVIFSNRLVGQVVQVIPEALAAQSQAASSLPYTVSAASSTTLGLEWVPVPAQERLLVSALQVPVAQRHITLRLMFDPGGVRKTEVRLGQVLARVGGWSTLIWLNDSKAEYLEIYANSRASLPGVATFQVWSDDLRKSTPILTQRRPAGYGAGAWFAIASLPPGGYVYAISVGSQTIDVHSFVTPCEGTDGGYDVTACAFGDAKASAPIATGSPRPYGVPATP